MRAILDVRLNRRALTRRGSWAAILLLLSALIPVAALNAQENPAPPPANDAPAPPARDAGTGSPRAPATRPTTNPSSGRPGLPSSRPISRGGFGRGATPTLGEGPTCALDATIYDVRLPADQIGKLDIDALAEASATADAFEKALAALGKAQPLYRAHQSVRLSGDTIMIGSDVPIVVSTRVTDKGQSVNSVQYMSTGAIFTLAGKVGATGIDLDLGIELSSTSDGGADLTDKVKANVMRKATLSCKGPAQPRKPFVVVSVDAGSLDKDGKAVAYIGRVMIGEPQPPAPK